MATEYTEIINRGGSFQDYAWRCANAFIQWNITALSLVENTKNNDPFNESILYLLSQIKQRTENLNSLKAMSEQEKEIKAENDYREKYASRNISHSLRMQSLAKYESIQVQVLAWEPPTKEHQKLKAFMLRELRSTIDSDCISTNDTILNEVRPSTSEWYKEHLELAEKSLDASKIHLNELLKDKENSFNFAIELAKSIGLPKGVVEENPISNQKAEYLKAKQNRQNQLNQLTKNNDSVSLLIGILLVSISVFGIVFRPVLPVGVMDNLFFAACILTILWLVGHFNKNRNLNNNQNVK